MWLLIFWLSSPFNVSSGDARQPTLAVHSQAFHTDGPAAMHCAPLKRRMLANFLCGAFVFLTEIRRRRLRAHDGYY